MEKIMKYLLLILATLLIGESINNTLFAGGSSSPGPPGYPKIAIDKSNYTLPNGMNYEAVFNMQQPFSQFSNLVFQGATTLGLTGTTQIGEMAVDAQGNRYITGGFTGTIQYGEIVVESSGGYDVFVAKLNPNGEVLWYQIAQGSQQVGDDFSLEGGLSLALDNDGNVYVGGSFVKQIQFTSTSGEELETLTDGREDDLINLELFVAKYTSDGAFLWAIGGKSGSDASENNLSVGINSVNSIMIDTEGYPYIAGGFSGTSLFGYDYSVNGSSDFFIASLSKDGNEVYWADVFGTPGRDYAQSISVDTLGYLNILGVIGEGIVNLPNSDIQWNNDTGVEDTFIISYDVNGEWYFASFLGAGDQLVGNSIASTQDGSIYMGGFFSGTALIEGSDEEFKATGIQDGLLVKYDLNGDMIWARHFGFEVTNVDVVVLDENEDVLVLGRFSDSIIFEANSDNPVMLTTESLMNMFIAKYDKSGNFIWAKNIEGSGFESQDVYYDAQTRPFSTKPLDLKYSPLNNGEIILTGDFDNELILDDIQLSANGSRKLFMAVMQSSGAVSVEQPEFEKTLELELSQNYPNPFNPSTTIEFNLPLASQVSISVFNAMGQKVATISNNELFSAGKHRVSWNASNLSSGTYMYTLNSDEFSLSRKMTLIK